jgi:hypothetical protein
VDALAVYRLDSEQAAEALPGEVNRPGHLAAA